MARSSEEGPRPNGRTGPDGRSGPTQPSAPTGGAAKASGEGERFAAREEPGDGQASAGDAAGPRKRLRRVEAREQTRQRLLDAAAVVFAAKGFAGASVEEIAEAAGYSTGALYSNFAGKEQLFLELLAARRARSLSRRAAAIGEILEEHAGDGDPYDALASLFGRLADRSNELAPLQAEFWLYAVRNPEAMSIIAARSAEQLDTIERLVAAAIERSNPAVASRRARSRTAGSGDGAATPPPPRHVEPRAVATVALALVQGLTHLRRIDPAAVPDELYAQALRWMMRGSGAAPGSGQRSGENTTSATGRGAGGMAAS